MHPPMVSFDPKLFVCFSIKQKLLKLFRFYLLYLPITILQISDYIKIGPSKWAQTRKTITRTKSNLYKPPKNVNFN